MPTRGLLSINFTDTEISFSKPFIYVVDPWKLRYIVLWLINKIILPWYIYKYQFEIIVLIIISVHEKKSLDNRGTYRGIFTSAPYMKDKYATCEMIMLTCNLFMSACNINMLTFNIFMSSCKKLMLKCNFKLCCMPT